MSPNSRQVTRSEGDVIRKYGLELDALATDRYKLDCILVDDLYNLVQQHKTNCASLISRRDGCIQTASLLNRRAGQILDDDPGYRMAIADLVAFSRGGMIFQLGLDNEAEFEHGHGIHDRDDQSDRMSRNEPTPRPNLRPTTRLTRSTTAGIDKTRSKQHQSQDTIVDLTQSSEEDGGQVHEWPIFSSYTVQPPIRLNNAKNGHYWVFQFRFRQDAGFYIMRCPLETCQRPVFNEHPLKKDRAAVHLRACGQHFKDEQDMVRRYSRQVIPTRKGAVLSWNVVRIHNKSLIPQNSPDLDEENVECLYV